MKPESPTVDTVYLLPLSQYPNLDRVVKTQKLVYIPDLTKQGQDIQGTTSESMPISLNGLPQPQRSWLGIPIIYKGEVIGVLTATHQQVDYFSPRSQMLAQTFTNYVAYAIANAQAYERAKQGAAEAERKRIAGLLHDSVSQTLFAASATVQSLARVLVKNPETAEASVAELTELVAQAQVEMRSLLLEMLSANFDDVTLQDLIRHLCQEFQQRWNGALVIDVKSVPPLPPEVQQAYYYIAQETLNNIAKHANATTVTVCLYPEGQQVTLEISDNGTGFDPSQVRPGHFGQGIMRERAHRIGARLEVTSEIGSGSKMTLEYLVQD
jgi:signal transduction histidine kinase